MEHVTLVEAYMDLLEPLQKWKILPIELLVKEAGYSGKMSNLYKKISYLERAGLIESFIHPTTKKKFVYLLSSGFKALGFTNIAPTFKENRFHDSICTQVLYEFAKQPFVKKVKLEHEIIDQYPGIQYRPDGLVEGHITNDFKLAIECELTQKSRKRILEKFNFYNKNLFFNNVIYVFGLSKMLKTYLEIMQEQGDLVNQGKFLFLNCPRIYDKDLNILDCEAIHKSSTTTLRTLFSNRGET